MQLTSHNHIVEIIKENWLKDFYWLFQVHKKKLYTASHDHTMKVWDASNLREDEEDDDELIEVITTNGSKTTVWVA